MSVGDEREQHQRVRERFTRSADAFLRLAVPHRAGEAETIARLAAPLPGEIALDLACGPGTFTLALARQARLVVGVDLTPAFLERARQVAADQGAANVVLVCADAAALPCSDDSIDVAVSGYSLHHMARPFDALGELARVVRPGGRLALVDLIVPDGADAEANDRIERCRDSSHTHTLFLDQLRRMVEDAGFRIRSTESIERPRRFADWLRISGWEPTDPAWRQTRRLMEAAMDGDASGFRPRLVPGVGGAGPEIEFTQSCSFLAAWKP
ncbi:MAG TPA: methyltransferase domain-containing protein [Candidatus Acidoferrales bacterium]|nr:methyltransferase domain-containing protein [Candidatus Acidoferrales bacterium]